MPSGEQLKALLQSHVDGDEARFLSIAMQMAAHEAKLGHGKLAQELRDLIDKVKTIRRAGDDQPIPLVKPRGELSDILSSALPSLAIAELPQRGVYKGVASLVDSIENSTISVPAKNSLTC